MRGRPSGDHDDLMSNHTWYILREGVSSGP